MLAIFFHGGPLCRDAPFATARTAGSKLMFADESPWRIISTESSCIRVWGLVFGVYFVLVFRVGGLGFGVSYRVRFSVFGFRKPKSRNSQPGTAFANGVLAVLGIYYLCVSVTSPETRNPEPGSGFRVPGSGFRGSGLGHRVVVGAVVVRLQIPRPRLVLLEVPCFRG